MLLSGAQILVECLKEQNVDTVFGFPGGTVLNIYDELYKHKEDINHILTTNEQAAAHAADGYARSTGKVGVCIATSGPGATNLVTGVATAYMDSVPVVYITGNVGLDYLGKDSFQEVDIAGITMPITKHNFIVKDISLLADTIRRAFDIARSRRPGPVLIDIVKDVTEPDNIYEYEKMDIDLTYKRDYKLNKKDIKELISLIRKSKKPLICAGGGAIISGASQQVLSFSEVIDAPVCDSLMGKGIVDTENDNYIGMVGIHGTNTANKALKECDLLVAVGMRFGDRLTGNSDSFAEDTKVIHIDVDRAEINKNVMSYMGIVGDVRTVLEAILKELDGKGISFSHEKWQKHIEELKESDKECEESNNLTAPYVIKCLNGFMGEDDIIVTDVGQHQMWTAKNFHFRKPHRFLTSGGLGTMGYGLGAALGAKIGHPNLNVVNISGDGCFRMNMGEIITCVNYNAKVIDIVFNNSSLGMVRQMQTLFCEKRYSETDLSNNADYCKMSEAMGAKSFRITKKEEVNEVLKKAFSCDTTVVIECIINREDMVGYN
ncbi:MAG: biosynthetic-type acetolactate synthase large subunit [Lachnospiraceae bacterium]|nr:biosynthetic-type acetolactate synthase large subunit [Lachnospiraceae bacterium]